MEPQADPVARGQEDEPVEGTHGEAYGERPELPLEREIAKEHETTDQDQDQVQEDCRRPPAASTHSQASGHLGSAESDDETPMLIGERDHGIDEGDARHPVEPAGAKPAPPLELPRASGRVPLAPYWTMLSIFSDSARAAR